MFVVNKILQTALKTYFGKYVVHESRLDNLKLESDGNIELCDIEFNCKEINQHLKKGGGLRVDQFVVKKMNVTVNWEHIVNKLELTDVVVNLSIRRDLKKNLEEDEIDDEKSGSLHEKDEKLERVEGKEGREGREGKEGKEGEKSEEWNEGEESQAKNSIFFYSAEKSLTNDSLLTQEEFLNDNNIEGYQTMLSSVDSVTKKFEIILNSTQVHMDSIWFTIEKISFKTGDSGGDSTNSLVLENVKVYNDRICLLCIPTIDCKMGNSECHINIVDRINVEQRCSLENLAQTISILFKYIKQMNKTFASYAKVKKEKNDEKDPKIHCSIKKICQDNFVLDDIQVCNDPIEKKTNIKISSFKTPFISAKNFNANVIKRDIEKFDEDIVGLFSKKAVFYEDGHKKPECASTLEQRTEYYKQNRRFAKHYVQITADRIEAIDIKGFVNFCKNIYSTIHNERHIFLNDKDTNEAEETNTNIPKFFVEIRSNTVGIKLFKVSDESTLFLNSSNTHLTISQKYWSVQSKHIDLICNSEIPTSIADTEDSKAILLGTFDKTHLAGTLSLDHIVGESEYVKVKNLPKLSEIIMPLLEPESEPMQLKMNLKIGNIQGADQMMNQKLYYQGQQCEVFANSSDNITCTLQSLLVDVDNHRLIDGKLIHIKLREKIVHCSIDRIDSWICAKELPEMIDNLKHFVYSIIPNSKDEEEEGEGEEEMDSELFDGDNFENETNNNEKEKRKLNIIENYDPDTMEDKVNTPPVWKTLKNEFLCGNLTIHILSDSEHLGTVPLNEINHISLEFNHARMFIFKDDLSLENNMDNENDSNTSNPRIEFMIQSLEVKDGIQSSLWSKAVRTGDIKIIYIDRYLSLDFGKEIYLHIDQRFLEFVQLCINTYNRSYRLRFYPNIDDSTLLSNFGIGPNVTDTTNDNANDDDSTSIPPFRSIHISKMIFNFDYKPQDGGGLVSFVNCDQIRGSKIVFNEFYLFQIKTWSILINQFVINLFSNIQNLQGIVSGIKPLRPIATILSSSKNLLILPVNNYIGKKRSESFTKQIKNILKDVTVEVLELGSAMHVNINKKESIYSNQPRNWKEGIDNGKKEFEDNCQTIIAFVQNSDDVDLVNLPIVMVRPITGFMSQFFQGLANQLKPSRKELMDNKYKKVKII